MITGHWVIPIGWQQIYFLSVIAQLLHFMNVYKRIELVTEYSANWILSS